MSAHVSTRLRLSAHASCRVSAVLVCSCVSLCFSVFLRRFSLSLFPSFPGALACSLARSHTQSRFPPSHQTLQFASAPSNQVCGRRLSCAHVHLCITSTQAHKHTQAQTSTHIDKHTHTHIDTRTHTHRRVSCANVHMCICAHRVHTHVHAHTHTLTHTHTYTDSHDAT
jgi:hypothetical protein